MVTAVPSRGFTLIELMVVLAVLALLLTVAVPFFPKALPGAEIKGAARELAAGLRTARSRAITLNREVGFTLDVEGRRFAVNEVGEARELPPDVEISFVTARSELLDETTGVIRFFPDGSSTGGRVSLAHGARGYHVDVDWLTGRISILD